MAETPEEPIPSSETPTPDQDTPNPATPEGFEGSQEEGRAVREIFDAKVEEVRAREDLSPKQRRQMEREIRQLEASMSVERFGQKVDTRKEIDALSDAIEDALLSTKEVSEENIEEDGEEGNFPGNNPDDLSEIVQTAVRKEEAENRINELGFEGMEAFAGVETVEDLAELSVDQLLALEAKHEGILLYAFTDFVGRKEKVDLAHFEEFYSAPKAGTKIQIDFRGNPEAEAMIGASEIFPPAVRRITVYANGDKKSERTSVARRDLKGSNKDGDGFYDNEGYIPVYTGDVVVIGGEKRTPKDNGVDLDFEKRFRKADGTIDQEAYQTFFDSDPSMEETRKFFKDLESRPGVQRSKQMTTEEIDEFMEAVDTTGNGENIVERALREIERGQVRGDHCWDWVHKIYKKEGMTFRRVYQDLNYTGKNCGSHHASDALIDTIEPGDWLYVNNKNSSDTHGNHSVIFLGWIDRGNKIARTASCPGSGKLGQVDRPRDLNAHPVTHISKPVPASGGGNRRRRRRSDRRSE
ncbi:MAG: hypothetical protein Q8P27_00805 [Candidatus Peregrinibacteria bacterium]|nr:hypothetical protein [Candidatus Peregrinibacteria bacterium]